MFRFLLLLSLITDHAAAHDISYLRDKIVSTDTPDFEPQSSNRRRRKTKSGCIGIQKGFKCGGSFDGDAKGGKCVGRSSSEFDVTSGVKEIMHHATSELGKQLVETGDEVSSHAFEIDSIDMEDLMDADDMKDMLKMDHEWQDSQDIDAESRGVNRGRTVTFGGYLNVGFRCSVVYSSAGGFSKTVKCGFRKSKKIGPIKPKADDMKFFEDIDEEMSNVQDDE